VYLVAKAAPELAVEDDGEAIGAIAHGEAADELEGLCVTDLHHA